MKRKKQVTYGTDDDAKFKGETLREAASLEPMVRTQIYLSRTEHEFIQTEAARRSLPMAAVIRGFIDERMNIPEDSWANNPMLQNVEDDFNGPEDGAMNHDHYVSGAPKRFVKKGSEWVEASPLNEDHYDKPGN